MWRLVTFVATFSWNARRMLAVKNSRQMLRAHRKRTERRRKVKNGKGERIGGELEGSILQCKMRQDKAKLFLFSYWKGKKVVQEKEEEGRKRGGGGVFDPFQRYYKLSECSCWYMDLVLLVSFFKQSSSSSSSSLFFIIATEFVISITIALATTLYPLNLSYH